MGTPSEEVGYSLAITITLCTPAPLCPLPPPPSPCPLRCSSCFAPLVRVWTRRFLLLSLSQPFLIASLPCRSLSPRPPIILLHRPRLFRNCFQPSLLLLRLPLARRISRAFRYYVLYWSFSPSLSLSFPFSRLFPSLFIPFSPSLPGTPGWHQFPEPSHLPPHFCVSSPPFALPFILEMDIGIHETKLMITTSKQRRTTNSYLSILLPASPPFTSNRSDLFADFFLPFSRSSSFYFFAISSYLFLFRYVFHFYILLLECFSHSK